MRGAGRSLVVLISLAAGGCAGRAAPAAGEMPEAAAAAGDTVTARRRPSRADMLTSEEIERHQHGNVYDLVVATRPRWLRTRGSDTLLGSPTQVQVLLDGVPLGDVQSLTQLNTMGVRWIQFIDGNTAAARWGLGYGQGAIYVATRDGSTR